MPNITGWTILRNWNIQDFDRSSIIKHLHVQYGVSPYFRVSVQPHPRAPGSYSITISPSGLGLPDRSYYYTSQNDCIQIAYKQLISDVVILFSTITKTDAQKFGEDMFSYEKRIAEITPSLHETVNPVNTYNPVKLSELKLTVSSIPLQDILTAMYPEYNVTEETEVIVTSLHYLTEVSRITTSTDSETLNSYLMWTLLREYLPYLSTKYTSTLNLFQGEIYGYYGSLSRWEKCAALVQNVMGFAVESVMEVKYPIKQSTVDLVESIFEEIRSSAQERLLKMQISSAFYKYLSSKLSRLRLQIGLPNVTKKNPNYVKDYYNKLMILKGSLFESIKNSLFFKKRIEEKLLVSPLFQDQNLVSYLVEKPDQVSYVPSANLVIVPRMMLTDPLFRDQFPRSILYGRLGVSIAEAVISSIFPYESMWTADLKLLSPFHLTVNESYETMTNAKNCLSNFTESNLGFKPTPELITLNTGKHLFAVSTAHQALKNSLSEIEHTHQPSLEKLEDSALFFLAYSQSQCSVSSTSQDLYDNVVRYKLPQKSLLGAVWSYLSDFSESLQCSNVVEERCSVIF
ncbi:hypothetical protein RN001_010024 [Aquatica leii]|uniref:Peptidase M13 N-terminal domain-containing protein n=1 Tax=Aquatica leii TaxID=1421715 RepID=A0AAN7QH69_9COLE|nr:hypothetical protein RN001_010024 [Aquatica leii]